MREAAAAALGRIRGKARSGDYGDGQNAEGATGLLCLACTSSFHTSAHTHALNCGCLADRKSIRHSYILGLPYRNDAFPDSIPKNSTREFVFLNALETCRFVRCPPRFWSPTCLPLHQTPDAIGRQLRRWKRPKRTARSSRWSSASERYFVVCIAFLTMPAGDVFAFA